MPLTFAQVESKCTRHEITKENKDWPDFLALHFKLFSERKKNNVNLQYNIKINIIFYVRHTKVYSIKPIMQQRKCFALRF